MNRYYFEIPNVLFGLFKAQSRLDAQHQLMNSDYAHLYGQVRWLSSDDDYPSINSEDNCHPKVAILHPHRMPNPCPANH